ncbi:MAG: EAL domain-containing protein [Bacillota bacterium]|nr:EAL domain-containing protein [Bacillota bacterium]
MENNNLTNDSYKNKNSFIIKNNLYVLLTITCFLLLPVTLFLQFGGILQKDYIKAILSQAQILLSVSLTILGKKSGYIATILLNMSATVITSIIVIKHSYKAAIPGAFIPLISVVIVTVIYTLNKKINNKINEATVQNEELNVLYEEVLTKEEELSRQNADLVEFNKTLDENRETLDHLANYNYLTDLPNLKNISNVIDSLIKTNWTCCSSFSIVFIDINNFKRINDTMGHPIGDLVLKEVAEKVSKYIDSQDLLGHIDGDEFLLLIKRNLPQESIQHYIEGIRNLLLNHISVDNNDLRISSSYGIAVFPKDATTTSDLLKMADTAMYKAKKQKKDGIQFFTKEMKDEIVRKMSFENSLMLSITNNELFLVFQPQYDTKTKELRGFESLIRWNSKEFGFISPINFIPSAEETGFINTMGQWIFESACEYLKKWIDKFNKDIKISVNISAIQIRDPFFVENVEKTIKRTGIKGKNLEFEITESVLISSVDYTIDLLNRLRQLGIKIALDDFGTGYSSLSYINSFPIDVLKIDKSFIDSIDVTSKHDSLVSSIISLVHNIGIVVVSEGVETEEQLEYLNKCNCDYIQGFLWGKPLSIEQVEVLLNEQTEDVLINQKDVLLNSNISS